MKGLPIGIQEFSELISRNCIYVDKTKHIFELLKNKYYFLSRPRRFGKSLLLNTIKEIFNGNKQLFEGLWIYDQIDWEVHPVIKISFSKADYKAMGLAAAIDNMLEGIAATNGITLKQPTYSLKFEELILKLSKDKKVVILIDEYDKPIIDYIDDIPQAEENRKILKSFYSVIKDSDGYIQFFLITGVSKFSQVSIFSDLNNLNDITLNRKYATMLGYTQEELEQCFGGYIRELGAFYKQSDTDIYQQIKVNYNGYSWDGVHFVYNPFSVLNLLDNMEFGDYWFRTGTPTFLMKLIRDKRYTIFDIEKRSIFKSELDKYDITNLSLIPLLFQTGYLTIKESDLQGILLLDFPNAEVERSFTIHVLAAMEDSKVETASSLLVQLIYALRDNKIDKFIELINIIYKGISYTIIDQQEKYFHSIFYLIVKLIGFTIASEILTIDGRIDVVIKTTDRIYVIEFKIDQDAQTALQQIKDKSYHEKYLAQGKPITLLGINFDMERRVIDDYVVENG